jgi:hypothetical protein
MEKVSNVEVKPHELLPAQNKEGETALHMAAE